MKKTPVLSFGQIEPEVEDRVDALLGRMTLAEKVGQMNQSNEWVLPDIVATLRAGGLGSLLSTVDVRRINELQRLAVEESRLGIPLLIGNDVIHGYRTLFPIPLAEACSWDTDLLERTARIASEEAAACGTNWIFAPMVDICRDPRWGRIAEGAGEDVFLGMELAKARVRGIQAGDLAAGRRVAACPKHYVAYGAAEAGRDYNTVDMSERTLRDVFLPPFKAAFEAGAGSTMSAFNDLNGVPATANIFTLRTILREEWGWDGVVLSDYNAVGELIDHGIAADARAAAQAAALAGVDMDMVTRAFGDHLLELVESGAVPLAVVDAAVRRILRLKFQLGLFEQPYADEHAADTTLLRAEFRATALEAARKSMVLLKNAGDLLPLGPQLGRIAVIGPLADDKDAPLGTWRGQGDVADVESVLDGITAQVGDARRITHVAGCSVGGVDTEFDAAVAAARDADITIMVLGESADMSGEAHSRAYLGLPGQQQALLEAVHATGTPVVVVLLTGRPLVIPWMAEHVPAILLAWHAGMRTGAAVADLLWGAANPSGKLVASFPRAEGQIPVYYSMKHTGRPAAGAGTKQFDEPYRSTYIDVPNAPLFPFGFGLGYARFDYTDLHITQPELALGDTLEVRATVRNAGAVAGDEIVQLYVRDDVASVAPAVKQLRGFQRITLAPGAQQEVRFDVPVAELGFVNSALRYVVEPGTFTLWVGPDSTGGLEARVTVRDA